MLLTERSALTSLVSSARRPSVRPRRDKIRIPKRLFMNRHLAGWKGPSLVAPASEVGDQSAQKSPRAHTQPARYMTRNPVSMIVEIKRRIRARNDELGGHLVASGKHLF